MRCPGADRGKSNPVPRLFWEPTVLAEVPETARIMREEPFGPVAILNRFVDFGDAITKANQLPYGLAAFAFTSCARTLLALSDSIEAGMVGHQLLQHRHSGDPVWRHQGQRPWIGKRHRGDRRLFNHEDRQHDVARAYLGMRQAHRRGSSSLKTRRALSS